MCFVGGGVVGAVEGEAPVGEVVVFELGEEVGGGGGVHGC